VKCKVLAKIHVVIDFSLIVGSDWIRLTVGNLFHSLRYSVEVEVPGVDVWSMYSYITSKYCNGLRAA